MADRQGADRGKAVEAALANIEKKFQHANRIIAETAAAKPSLWLRGVRSK